jgi:hypothetical protein
VNWWRLEAATWVDHGTFVVCAWEGVAIEVPAGNSYLDPLTSGTPAEAGRYRLTGQYGVGCLYPDRGLSQAGCTAFFEATSNEIVVPATGGTGGTTSVGPAGGSGGTSSSVGLAGGGTGGIDLTELHTACVNDACPPPLTPVKYYGVAGSAGPLFCSCEIPCVDDPNVCPPGTSCGYIADGPGDVCME